MEQFVEHAKKLVGSRPDVTARLSERQRQVCEMLVAGMEEPQIAEVLARSKHTVHDHTKAIYAALKVANRTQLVLRFTMPEVLL